MKHMLFRTIQTGIFIVIYLVIVTHFSVVVMMFRRTVYKLKPYDDVTSEYRHVRMVFLLAGYYEVIIFTSILLDQVTENNELDPTKLAFVNYTMFLLKLNQKILLVYL